MSDGVAYTANMLTEYFLRRASTGTAEMRTVFRLQSLGRLRLYHGFAEIVPPRTANARALLTYLVAHSGQDIPRERLIELFWSDSDVDHARGSLKTALWLIRAAIRIGNSERDEWLYTNKTIARWDAPTSFDRNAFLEAAKHSDPDSLRLALRLYAGDFLEGHYGEWVDAERARIANVYESVLFKMMGAAPDARLAERLLERNPYSEEAYRILIEERLAAGSFRSAARFAEQCVAALAEVGATPSEDFVLRMKPVISLSQKTRYPPAIAGGVTRARHA